MLLPIGVVFVVIPAIWIFFYKGSNVKATCEARNPSLCWTDACPLPVLAGCLWLVLTMPMMLMMPIFGHGVMPFFGMFLSGLPGTLFCIIIAAIWGCSAWLMYRLDVRGWWLVLIALVVGTASALLTYARHDPVEMYELMQYPQTQIEQMQKTGLFAGNRMSWLMLFSLLPSLGYLLFIKKYFRNALDRK
jgi:hypothetical protein